MSGKHKKRQEVSREPEQAPSADMYFGYANFVSVTASLYDLQLEFGVEMDGTRTPTARIAMSPQHAKSMQLILDRLLREYENNVGPIAIPDEVRDRLASSPRGEVDQGPEEPS